MKKIIATVIAGVFAASSVACLAACGDKGVAEKADKEAPAYAEGEWDASLDLNAVMTGDEGAISPDLFGLFLEDINYAGFALDDNLIINGSFETLSSATSNTKEYGWTENGATITVRSGEGALHANNQSYASVTVSAANGKLSNSGHAEVPVAVKKDVEYKFSMFIKDYAGDVTVSVKNKQGDEYASGTFTVAESAEWTKYIKTVKATGTAEEDLRVEIAFSAADTFSIDSVKFETADATDFGMKNYMYKAIEELGPKFFRFPGGCVIEGTNFNEAYDWKNSIGAVSTGNEPGDDDVQAFTYPVNDNGKVSTATTYGEQATRKENLDIWQGNNTKNDYYNLEYGIGFYEFFCLCDALNAKAVPIVNCGKGCQTQGNGPALKGRHDNGISDYIQDAIDLIEFAKGDKNTKWGAIRAKMGHPEPFAMDYIGVGNEQWGDYYKDYYEQFLKDADFQAALAKYKVQPIVGNSTMFGHCENADGKGRTGEAQRAALAAKGSVVDTVAEYGVHDQHYYVNYTDFFLNTKMYDSYARPSTSPDIYYNVFVGEYAANAEIVRSPDEKQGVEFAQQQNSWITALSEAAMMTGFERNGDIVKLAAYAPMFGVADKLASAREAGKSSSNQWNAANMMYFTNNTVVCTPNYYVQQLFMKNSGTRKVVSSLTFAEGEMPQTTVKQKTGSGTRTYDNIYYVTSYDEATKNLIVKIVNAGDTGMKFNVNVKTDKTLTGIAQVTEVVGDDPTDVNTYAYYDTVTAGKPYKIGFDIESGAFGISLKPYSVIAIRIRTK